jgi:DHA1 family tetracycline resistance protein-like MFS transporter
MRRLIPILGITFVDIIGFSILIPMMPYFVVHFGASPFVVGVIIATFQICQLLSAPIWGNVSDRLGRKVVLVTSQIGATIGWAMLAFAPTLPWVFAARIVEGVSGGNIGITQAYVADLVAPKERARAFSYIGATFGAGMVFGPVIGGVLFARYGFKAPFLAAAAFEVLTLVLTLLFVPESRGKEERREHIGLREALASFRKPAIASVLVQRLALSLGMYGWYAVIALYLQRQLSFTLVRTDFYFAAFAVVSVFMNAGVVGSVSRGTGDRRMSNIGLASLLAGFILSAFVHSIPELVAVLVLFSFGSALAQNGITALISNAVREREQGTVLSTASSLDSLSGIVAPLMSTALLGFAGPAFAGVSSAVFALVALIMGVGAARPARSPSL